MTKRVLCLLLAAFCAASCLFGCVPPDVPAQQSQTASSAEAQSSAAPGESEDPAQEAPDGGTLKVHFIDVGQGDSVFIELPGGENLLIDSGERDFAGRVISYIDRLGCRKIDYLLATHPHTDHMGGMAQIIGSFVIGRVYMPDAVATHSAFSAMLGAVSEKGLKLETVSSGALMFEKDGLRAEFLGPLRITPENLNNCSAVLRLQYGGTSFLFTGDAEKEEEAELVSEYGEKLKSDVVKIGHHGSADSSSEEFVRCVGAKIGIISCGADNPYGHPVRGVMTSWLAAGMEILLRTDLEGTVTVVSDGETVSVAEKTAENGYRWVVNLNGKKIHEPDCAGATNIAERNRVYSVRTIAELEALGFTPCGTCRPEE
ncbi:MAG: MBL fold metallo-hydrolase [Clostridia bacterium]|nr:MBL fold metallo-hydrolase [Clostridia bacterium]